MTTLRTLMLTLCGMLGLNAPLLAQVYEAPGPPPEESPILAWVISAFLFLAILTASMKSAKRSQQN